MRKNITVNYWVEKTEFPYQEGWFRLQRDTLVNAQGNRFLYPMVHIKPVAAVLGIDAENHIILQREYRPTYRKTFTELSCGGLDSNEKEEIAAAREFKEETGYEVGELEKIGTWHTLTGKCIVDLHMFFGRAKRKAMGPRHLDTFELIEPFRVPAREAIQMILDGEIINAEHIALIFFVKEKYPQLFK